MTSPGVVIVGGGPAAQACATGLRRRGYVDPVTIVSREPTPPYDRTLLSKEFLANALSEDALALESPSTYADQSLELLLARTATGIDTTRRRVFLDDGIELAYDSLVIATGRVAVLPEQLQADGVHTLRDITDARRLRQGLGSYARVGIVGGGFVGLEVAASLRKRGHEVIVVEALPAPFSRGVGATVGQRIAALHRSHGVDLRVGQEVLQIKRNGPTYTVRLRNGDEIGCDGLVVAVGSRPAVDWLAETPLAGGRLVTGPGGETAIAGVFAAGDCATWGDDRGVGTVVEHWEVARQHGEAAAAGIVGEPPPPRPLPYFWSDQYDVRYQSVGSLEPADRSVVEPTGDSAEPFVARYYHGSKLCAVFAANAPAAIAACRQGLNEEVVGEPNDGEAVVRVDRDVCIGNGRCVRLLPTVFELDDEGIARASNADAADLEKLKAVARACPSGAIHVGQDFGSDEGPLTR